MQQGAPKIIFLVAWSMCGAGDSSHLCRTAIELHVPTRCAAPLTRALPCLLAQVRDAAFGALVALLDMVPPDVRRAKVMPVLREHMQPFELDAAMQRCIARNFGTMVTVIKGEMEQGDTQMFYGCFKHLASKADVELRRACASSFATLVKAAASLHPNAFAIHFSDTLQALAADYDEEVRVPVASSLHEVARWAGKEHCANLLTRPLTRLLRDESARVQAAVLPFVSLTLTYIAGSEDAQKDKHLDEILRALAEVEARSARNWRLQAQLAAAFPSFTQVFTSDQIYDNFLPMAFRFMSNSAAAVRPLAAEGVVMFLRYNRKERQRADIFVRLIREYARGKSYTARLAFAEVARHAVKRFSARFAKEWLFDLCLELLYDPVPNVRMQVRHVHAHKTCARTHAHTHDAWAHVTHLTLTWVCLAGLRHTPWLEDIMSQLG